MNYSLITDEPLNYCVYAHINKINGKMYIGITKNVKARWSSDGLHYNTCTKMYNAICKYGWDNFDHIVLIKNVSVSMALIIEAELIQKYDTVNNGYNIVLKSDKRTYYQTRKIFQYDFNGNYIREWDAIIDAINEYGPGIGGALKGKYYSSYGYRWTYEYYEQLPPYKINKNHHKYIEEEQIYRYDLDGNLLKIYNKYDDITKSKMKQKSIRALCEKKRLYALDNSIWMYETDVNNNYYDYILSRVSNYYGGISQYDYDGNLIKKYNSFDAVKNETNFNIGLVRQACNGVINTTNGFQWRYDCDLIPPKLDDYHSKKGTAIIQKTINGDFIKRYDSAMSAARIYGNPNKPNSSTILKVCHGKALSAYGYKWEFAS